ncbi:MAG: DUF86 domain-containing protein [Armatimonadetes bacterium]|nr:DUF86 domain-containing protein [Armatimonadota bacterium]
MWRDDAYLLDIIISSRKVLKYSDGLSQAEFDSDEIVQNAIMRMLEIIGEAARRVSQETRDAHADIPWAGMIGMRNRLIHEYFRIDAQKVWETIQEDIPALVALIEPLLPPDAK